MEKIFSGSDTAYIGTDDRDLGLFENQYPVPDGVTYNSYLVKDEKVVLFDTCDKRVTDIWLEKLTDALDGRNIDYLIISHMEPDHSASLKSLVDRYPNIKVVASARAFTMIEAFFGNIIPVENKIVVKDGDSLSSGKHNFSFYTAPMVHWPEVIMTYESAEKLLFTADAFGRFGLRDADQGKFDLWVDEARRYYYNIVGKYGANVQTVLKKIAPLDIKVICPLHGPVLIDELEKYIGIYDKWSKYEFEEKGVFVAYSSIYGHTSAAALKFADMLREKGIKVETQDLVRVDKSYALAKAFKYDTTVFASASYDAGVFTPMNEFLNRLKAKLWQSRNAAVIENGSFAPSAARTIKAALAELKDINIIDPTVTVRSELNDESYAALCELSENIEKLCK